MLILEIALGILLAGFLYRYWRRVGVGCLAVVALVIVVVFWQEVLGLVIAVPVLLLLLSTVGPAGPISNSRTFWQSVFPKDSGKLR